METSEHFSNNDLDKFAKKNAARHKDKHCALLAANTLQKAIDDYEIVKNETRKKFYNKK